MDVRLIAAIGRRGQLGLNGDMPWGRGHPEDLRRFRELTTGGVMLAGFVTFHIMRPLNNTYGRQLIADPKGADPLAHLRSISEHYPDRTIWVCGGAKTYARYAPHVTEFVIRRLDYDGPADTFLPPLWS